MLRNLLLASLVIIPVTLSTALIVSMRIKRIAEPERIEQFGIQVVRSKETYEFAMLAASMGVLVTVAYILLSQRWPITNELVAGLGFGIAIVLSAAAAFFRPQAGLAGVPELITLNLIWGAGYGWLLPFVIRHFGDLAVI